MLAIDENFMSLRKNQTYTLTTDEDFAVFKTLKGRRIIKIPMNLISNLKIKEASNDYYM